TPRSVAESTIEPVSTARLRKNGNSSNAQRRLGNSRKSIRSQGYRRLADGQKAPGLAGFVGACPDKSPRTGLAGWGARIRTWEWRNQNPLPYHLATPQQVPESRTELSSHAAAGP